MKKIYCLILMILTITYSHLSISREDVLDNESVALESLAYQLRIDPWFLNKLKDTHSGELLKIYNGLIKKFEKIGSLEDLLVQVGHYCRIQAGHGECNFNGTGKFGDFLYILEGAVGQGKMIVLISQRSPERTRVFQWDSHETVSLLYDSFNAKNNICKISTDISPLRLVKSLKYEDMRLIILDEDNAAIEPKRIFQLDITDSQCAIKNLK
ncbi:MAG: hypothetical protein VYD07_06090 [Pseudomonadota bacterium]|nr:hypothetical protein [Pseudomonadota bacterium]